MIPYKLNVAMSDYQSDPAYSASDIVAASRSIAQWKFNKTQPRAKTRPMEIGSATHLMIEAAVTGNKGVLDSIRAYDKGSSLTKAFKELAATLPTVHLLDAEEYELVERCSKAILDEPEVIHYLNGAIAEPSFFVKDPEFGFMRKCRPDFLHESQGVSINIKTTLDASEKGFFRSVADYGYDFQSLNYIDILQIVYNRSFDEVHILVEKADAGPCKVRIYSIDDDTLDQARAQMHKVFEKIKECEKTGKWIDDKASLMVLNIPAWARTVVGV